MLRLIYRLVPFFESSSLYYSIATGYITPTYPPTTEFWWEPESPLQIAFWSMSSVCLFLLVLVVVCCLLWRNARRGAKVNRNLSPFQISLWSHRLLIALHGAVHDWMPGKYKTVFVPDFPLEPFSLSLVLLVVCCLSWRNAQRGAKVNRKQSPFQIAFWPIAFFLSVLLICCLSWRMQDRVPR